MPEERGRLGAQSEKAVRAGHGCRTRCAQDHRLVHLGQICLSLPFYSCGLTFIRSIGLPIHRPVAPRNATQRNVALGKLEFWLPRHENLLHHVRKRCLYQSRFSRRFARVLYARLRSLSSSSIHRHPADYGSVYEATALPKYAGERTRDLDLLVPGAGGPNQVFAAHERGLLKRAKGARRAKQKQRSKLDESRPAPAPRADEAGAVTLEQHDRDTESDSSATQVTDDEAEWQNDVPGQESFARKRRRYDRELETRYAIDEELLYQPAEAVEALTLPEGPSHPDNEGHKHTLKGG